MKNQILTVIHHLYSNRLLGRLRTRPCLFITCALASLAPSPLARAVDPPPDGGYANENTAEGDDALRLLTTGIGNTAVGNTALWRVDIGNDNTAVGWAALHYTVGDYNTGIGMYCMFNNLTGTNNTAAGYLSLVNNNSGSDNTAVGAQALGSNVTGNGNTAIGEYALYSDLGGANTAVGLDALYANTTGDDSTAVGYTALLENTTGIANTAIGRGALVNNTIGSSNTALGNTALVANTTASSNTAIGNNALSSNTTGGSNIAVGDSAGSALTTGANNIDIGNKGVAGESKTIRIGKKGTQTTTVIAGINGTTVAGGIGVFIDSNGRLGTATSSARYKDNIQPMDKASEAILSLEPVTFRYKHEFDPDGIPQFGLIAEQVAKVNPDLVARDDEGKPITVRYEAVNAMLLNEFLKEHRRVEMQEATITQLKAADATQETTIARQQKAIAALTASLSGQASEIKKVSEQLAAIQPMPRLVNNH
jgi:hypothetical protein